MSSESTTPKTSAEWYALATGSEEDHPLLEWLDSGEEYGATQRARELRHSVTPLDFTLSLPHALKQARGNVPEVNFTPVFRSFLDAKGLINNGWDTCGVCGQSCLFAAANATHVRELFTPDLKDGLTIQISDDLTELFTQWVDEAAKQGAINYLMRDAYPTYGISNLIRRVGLLGTLIAPHSEKFDTRYGMGWGAFGTYDQESMKQTAGMHFASGYITGFDLIGAIASEGVAMLNWTNLTHTITRSPDMLRQILDPATPAALANAIHAVTGVAASIVGRMRGLEHGDEALLLATGESVVVPQFIYYANNSQLDTINTYLNLLTWHLERTTNEANQIIAS